MSQDKRPEADHIAAAELSVAVTERESTILCLLDVLRPHANLAGIVLGIQATVECEEGDFLVRWNVTQ